MYPATQSVITLKLLLFSSRKLIIFIFLLKLNEKETFTNSVFNNLHTKGELTTNNNTLFF